MDRKLPTALPRLPQEIINPDLPGGHTHQHRIRIFRDWPGKTFEEIVTGALDLNHLSLRDAAERTGLPHSRLATSNLRTRHALRETTERLAAGLKLPLDVLEVRNNRLPPGAEDDVDFQDALVRMWHRWVQKRSQGRR